MLVDILTKAAQIKQIRNHAVRFSYVDVKECLWLAQIEEYSANAYW